MGVTHMFSDGYSIIPILAELADLVAIAESSAEAPLPPLLPLPDPFAALEERVVRTIKGDHSMRDAMTHQAIGKTKLMSSREAITISATLPADVVGALKAAGRSLAVADDIAMLTVLSATLARWRSQPTLTIDMIVPNRDGVSESDLIGLFSDIRELDIRTAGFSFAGVALWLQNAVNERLWRAPPVGTQCVNTMINFEWSDFDSHQGFVQLPQPRQGQEHGVHNPLKLAVDQPDPHTWRLRTAFDTAHYERCDREHFFSCFRECLRAIVSDPLGLVWPPQPSDEVGEERQEDVSFSTTAGSLSPLIGEGGTGSSTEAAVCETGLQGDTAPLN